MVRNGEKRLNIRWLGASGWFLKMNKESGDFLASQFLKTAKESGRFPDCDF